MARTRTGFNLERVEPRAAVRLPHHVAVGLLWLVLGLIPAFVQAQGIVLHAGFDFDDGDPARDADGSKNGVVVWAGGGKVHVVRRGFDVSNGYKLVIQQGAIVKMAGDVTLDAQGNLVTWAATRDGYLTTTFYPWSADQRRPEIRIEGATITDIRDDSVGGDTNGDGSATTPTWLSFELGFAHSNSLVVNSLIRFGWIDRPGFATIRSNRFEYFGGICPDALDEDIDAAPYVSDNVFELASPGACGSLDFRGSSPVVTGNTIRVVPMGGSTADANTTGVLVGPCCPFNPQGPVGGMTVVSNNDIRTRVGIAMVYQSGSPLYTTIPFHAEIKDNRMRGSSNPVTSSPGAEALNLVLEADVLIEGNRIANFRTPLVLNNMGSDPVARPRLHHNVFSTEGVGTTSAPGLPQGHWSAGVFLDAENNDWGDPTGPLDASNSDGLVNARGRGVRLSNGIDYAPFVGSPDTDQPVIRIAATSSPDEPIPTGREITVTPTLTGFDVGPAGSGTIRLYVRDENGYFVRADLPETPAVAGTNPVLAPFTFEAPISTRFVTVEAVLSPSDGSEPVTSNLVNLAVDRPASRFKFRIVNLGNLNPLWQIFGMPRGITATFRAGITYTLPDEGGGRLDVSITEEDLRTGRPLAPLVFTPSSIPLQTGSGLVVEQEMSVTLPLRDVMRDRTSAGIKVLLRMRNVAGTVVAEESIRLPIDERSNLVKIRSFVPGTTANGAFVPSGSSYLESTGKADGQLNYTIQVGTPGVTLNWQVFSEGLVFDAQGREIHRYAPSTPMRTVYTRDRITDWTFLSHTETLPAGATRVRERLRLWAPDLGLNLAVDSLDMEVRAVAASQTLPLPAGGTNRLAFTAAPVALDFTARPATGSMSVSEFRTPWAGKTEAPFEAASTIEDLVPLKRYWAVTATGSGTWTGTITFRYDPALDLPSGVVEDSLVVTGFNPLSGSLEVLATTRDVGANTVAAPYERFFETWVVGARIRTAVGVVPGDLPGDFRIGTAWPNPFNRSTTIPFVLARSGPVRLEVYDALGRRVATLVEETLPAGPHETKWEAAGRASGTYWVRLATPSGVFTRGVVLVN